MIATHMHQILAVALGVFFYTIHKALVDIKMYTRMTDQMPIRLRYWYLLTDGVYLLGTILSAAMLAGVSYYAGRGELPIFPFIQSFVVGMLLGSEVWDLLFGYVVDGDPLYPFNNWYGGWGFKGSRTRRIVFDVCRIALAIFIAHLALIFPALLQLR